MLCHTSPSLRVPAFRRRGLSLLEVLVSLVIFLLGMIAIGRLLDISGEQAFQIKLQSQATQLCQAKLAEVQAGVVPLSSQGDMPFDDAPDWNWSVDAQQDSSTGLWQVKVKVSRQDTTGPKVECELNQFMLDPALRGNTLVAAPAPTSGQATAASGSGSGSGSGATGAGAANAGAKGVAPAGGGGGKMGGGGPAGGGKAPAPAPAAPPPAGGKAPAPAPAAPPAGGKGKGG
jgi:prepilin-type N-terminal cleavage/methylation domain-containing protein